MKYTPYNLQDVYDGESQAKFNVISTFAGGGGSSTGYRLAGGKILLVNEFVEEAVKTYSENYPNTKVIPDDIKELTGKDFLEMTGLKEGELDLLDGSPPCSAFSMSGALCRTVDGKHSDGWGQTKTYSDGKKVENIEDLFFEFLRVANQIRPKVIIAENVSGLTVGEAKTYFSKIQNTFQEIGYNVVAKVLDASYLGVAQSRKRVIFIGVRDDVTDAVGLNFMTIGNVFPEYFEDFVPVGEAVKGLKYDEEEVKHLTEKFMKSAVYATGSKMPKLPEKVLTGADYHPKGHHFNLKRLSLKKPSPTLTATGGSDTSAGPFHWSEDRKLTIDELKRIQSLPDDFKLTGRWNQKAERIGRMVPPLMMKAVAESVYEKVLKPYKELHNDGL